MDNNGSGPELEFESTDAFLARVNAWVNERCPSTGDLEPWSRVHDARFQEISDDLAELRRLDRAPDDAALCDAFRVADTPPAPPPAPPAPKVTIRLAPEPQPEPQPVPQPVPQPANPLLSSLAWTMEVILLLLDLLVRPVGWLCAGVVGLAAIAAAAVYAGAVGAIAAYLASWAVFRLIGVFRGAEYV